MFIRVLRDYLTCCTCYIVKKVFTHAYTRMCAHGKSFWGLTCQTCTMRCLKPNVHRPFQHLTCLENFLQHVKSVFKKSMESVVNKRIHKT